jgi:hypothetical protein
MHLCIFTTVISINLYSYKCNGYGSSYGDEVVKTGKATEVTGSQPAGTEGEFQTLRMSEMNFLHAPVLGLFNDVVNCIRYTLSNK